MYFCGEYEENFVELYRFFTLNKYGISVSIYQNKGLSEDFS